MSEDELAKLSQNLEHLRDLLPVDAVERLAALTVIRSPEYKTIYSNIFRNRVGTGDITLIFSKLAHAPNLLATGNLVEEQVEIVISWPQLKMLAQILTGVTSAIDERVGEIKIPQSFQINRELYIKVIDSLGFVPPAPKKGGE